MIFSIVEYLRKVAYTGGVSSYAKQLKDYLRLGFRKEVLDGINFEAILKGVVSGLDARESNFVMDGVVWNFITGQPMDPRREDRGEEKKLEINKDLWASGQGKEINERLRANVSEMFLKHDIGEPEEYDKLTNRLVVDEGSPLNSTERGMLAKIKPEIVKYLSVEIKNKLDSNKKAVMLRLKEKAPEDVLDPKKVEEDTGHERYLAPQKVDPGALPAGIDLDEVEAWVKRTYAELSPERVIFDNIISDKPLSSDALSEEIKKKTGKEVSRKTVDRMRDKLVGEIREKFFPGRKKVEPSKPNLHELSPKDLERFKDYLDERIDDEAISTRVNSIVDELAQKVPDKGISEKLKLTPETVNKDINRYIKKYYDTWNRLEKAAGMIYQKVADDEGILDEVLDGADKKQTADLAKFKALVERKILSRELFHMIVEFNADYDWKDIGLGKFSPEFDPDEGWAKDDPHFEWVSYSVHIDETLGKDSSIKYEFTHKLLDNGTMEGTPTSSLTVTKKGKEVIHETGAPFFKKFLDDYCVDLHKHGLPVDVEAGVSVIYKNKKLGRTYHNTHDFTDKMGGLAYGSKEHEDIAQQSKEFAAKRKLHQYGPTSPSATEVSFNVLSTKLKNIAGKGHIQESDKAKAAEYAAKIKSMKDSDPGAMELKNEISKFMESHYQSEKVRVKDVNLLDALK